MSSNTVKLVDLVKIKGGKRLPKNSNLQEEKNNHPYIRVRDMGNKFIPREGLEYVPNDIFPEIDRYIVEKGDLIISIVGTIGLVSMIDEYFHLASLTENCAKLSGLDKLDGEYLYYFLISKIGQNEILKNTVGAVQKKLPLYGIKNIDVFWPEREKREDLVGRLSTLDQKIHLNQQTNKTLEAMVQAIFKSWFVDFDPVRAKIRAKEEGRDANRAAMAAIAGVDLEQDWDEIEAALDQKLSRMSEAQRQQLHRTADLFPDELVDSELGEVPKGWGYGILGDICNVRGGFAFKSKLFKEEGVPVVKIKNINDNYTVDLKNGQFLSIEDTIDKDSYELTDGDYVLAMTGATVGKTGIVVSDLKKVMLNQRVAKFESEKFKGNINWFIHSAFLATNLKEQIVNTARGSAQPNISSSGIESAELLIPSNELIENFINITDPLFNQWIDNYKQNDTLSSLRDTLLPKLISGEVGL